MNKRKGLAHGVAGRAFPAPEQTALDKVVTRATQVIGDAGMALQWLGTPVRELNYATPVSLLGNPEGQKAVLIALDNLEHGAY